MNPIDFLRAFFSLGMIAWWVVGGLLLLFGLIAMHIGFQAVNFLVLIVGFIVMLIGVLAIYMGINKFIK